MPSTDEKKTNRWSLPLWGVVWLLLFLSSLLPIAIHHWRDMSASFDRLRYGWGLLPAELLFLSWLNDISYFIPVVVIALFVWGLREPTLRRTLLSIGALITTLFSAIYSAFALLVLSMYLVWYADSIAAEHQRKADLDAAEASENQDRAEQSVPPKSDRAGG